MRPGAPGSPTSIPSRAATSGPRSRIGILVAAGIGTVTYVCDDKVLAFGHPMLFTGQTNLGAHLANAIDIADDATCCPFKLAVLGALIGRVGQDRVSAISARTDRLPDVNRVTSVTRQGAKERNAESFVPVRTPPFYALIFPADHAFAQILAVVDAFEDGSVGIALDVRGHRGDGSEFRIRFGDRWIGAERRGEEFFNSADAGGFGSGLMLSWLVENGFEPVTLDRVEIDLDVGSANRWVITDMAVARNGGAPQGGSSVCVRRGDMLTAHVTLESEPGNGVQTERSRSGSRGGSAPCTSAAGEGWSPSWTPGRSMASMACCVISGALRGRTKRSCVSCGMVTPRRPGPRAWIASSSVTRPSDWSGWARPSAPSLVHALASAA